VTAIHALLPGALFSGAPGVAGVPETSVTAIVTGAVAGALATAAIILATRVAIRPSVRELRDSLARANDAAQALERRAGHDPLTGLPNRALFLERLERSLCDARVDGSSVAVLFLDLDRFKTVNDSLGHRAGDRLLCVVAERLRALVRNVDVVARLGGDEFVILVSHLDEPSPAISLAERIVAAVEDPIALDGTVSRISTSIGIAVASPEIPAESPELLVRNADVAMYRAKQTGPGAFEVFDAEMRHVLTARQQLETSFRQAVEAREVEVAYAPIVNVATGLIWGFEAIPSWTGPGAAPVAGAEVLTLAASLGLASEVGALLLGEACRQTASWRDRWPARHLGLVVKVSGEHLADPGAAGTILHALDGARLEAGSLTIEIDDDLLCDDARVLPVLASLKQLGIKVAVDDFGTGFSTLLQLRGLPFDLVTLDRGLFGDRAASDLGAVGASHTAGAAEDSLGDAVVVTAIVDLAHGIGMHTIATEVATAEHLAALSALGCDYAQGPYISPPTTPSVVESMIAAEPAPRTMPIDEAAAYFSEHMARGART
jgi:diguanylate cyclase (GGDEF)-like protein